MCHALFPKECFGVLILAAIKGVQRGWYTKKMEVLSMRISKELRVGERLCKRLSKLSWSFGATILGSVALPSRAVYPNEIKIIDYSKLKSFKIKCNEIK